MKPQELPFKNPEEGRAQLMRGAIAMLLRELYPNSGFRSHVRFLLGEFELSDQDLTRELAYLEELGYLRQEPMKLLGLVDTRLRLTAKGVAMVNQMDPEVRRIPEDIA